MRLGESAYDLLRESQVEPGFKEKIVNPSGRCVI